jgi:hypothetical protein
MDPLKLCVAKGKDNGKKFVAEKLRAKGFFDMLAPFENDQLKDFPTIFRLPLRLITSSFGGSGSLKSVESTLKKFALRAEELLLFSKSVRQVQFAVKRASGDLSVVATLQQRADPAEAPPVMQRLPSTIAEVRSLAAEPLRQVDRLTIEIARGDDDTDSEVHRWLVAHAVEASDGLLDQIEEQLTVGTAMLPHGAAALRLQASQDRNEYLGRVCCYMPIATMETGLPLVLHGCFALDSNRKAIHCSAGVGGKHGWNRALLQGPVSSSLALLVERACSCVDDGSLELSTLFSLMALPDVYMCTESTRELRGIVRDATLAKLLLKPVFPVLPLDKDGKFLSVSVHSWQRASSATLRVPCVLSATTQNELVNAGLPLVYVTSPPFVNSDVDMNTALCAAHLFSLY